VLDRLIAGVSDRDPRHLRRLKEIYLQAYLKLDHMDKSFTAQCHHRELKDINLTIDKGNNVSIIGHSGCGKSTLLNIVAG